MGALSLLAVPRAAADELKRRKHREAVDKGLAWLVKQQHRDGHWESNGAQNPGPMTALAGLALLLDGNTLREGRYTVNLQRATDWLLARAQAATACSATRTCPARASATMYLS